MKPDADIHSPSAGRSAPDPFGASSERTRAAVLSIPSFDPTQYKAGQRREWAVSADGWKRHWNIWEQGAQHLNERLVDLARIRPGHRVLDVGTGLGEPAFTAARRVGPNGSVVATDLSSALLSLAREEAVRLGLRNVEFREMDAEEPDLPAQSFDAALCRWALMFLPDLVAALTRLRALLVPDGRFAAAVWGSPEKVPFTSVPMGVITRVLQLAPPPAGTPGTFSLADEHVLERSFTQAGFAEVVIERQTLTFEYPSLEEFIEERPATSASIRIMLAEASAAQRETIWQMVAQAIGKYQDATGVLRIPTETLCVVGKA